MRKRIGKLIKRIPGALKLYQLMRAFRAPLPCILINRKKIKAYAQKHAGKRCFIIGNGPSLTPEDLDKLKGEYTFAANRINKIFDKTEWRPTYYCVQDVDVAEQMGEEAQIAASCAHATFLRMWGYKRTKGIYKRIKNVIWVPIVTMPPPDKPALFGCDATKYIYDGSSVTYMAMELAVFMGFTDIYLLGVDHSHPFDRDKNGVFHTVDKTLAAHFYETAQDNEGAEAYINRGGNPYEVTRAYQAAEDHSCRTGRFRIYNATRGGKLEVFERVDLDEIVNKK